MKRLVSGLADPWPMVPAILLGACAFFLSSVPVCAYTPFSPEVRGMLKRAVVYLDSVPPGGTALDQFEHASRLGGQALIGLACYKYEKKYNRVQSLPRQTQVALNRVMSEARNPAKLKDGKTTSVYSLGISLIFLTEVHATEHMQEIEIYLDALMARQKGHGGWGYSHLQTGDMSQMQYAILGAWSASQVAGVDVDRSQVERGVNYLLRVQDPGGGWGYQGRDPGSFTRVPQQQVRSSLVAAGLGSLFVAGDFLGMTRKGEVKSKKQQKLPPALIPVLDEKDRKKNRFSGEAVDIVRLKEAMNGGNGWFRKNYSIEAPEWQFYYLYALERYQSFREKVEGTEEEEPRWYNDGVKLLMRIQKQEGYWDGGGHPSGCDKPVGTAFACLFLLRSTQMTVAEVVERDGLLRGGRDLPSDLTEVRLKDNKIVAPAITGDVADMISMLEDDEADKIENMLDNPDALSLSGLTGGGRDYTARLTRILRNGSYKARIVAARTLGRQGDLDNVPILIYALTDGDIRVVREARDGLRLISRRFDGVGMPNTPEKSDVKAAVTQWKDWYRSVKPDAVFIQ